ncbi:oligoribonuclease [Blastococcus sp. Marseille-P5729]|uniref:oligoribonuclease n=1 Tax=Blastococcus sp. Marseille-P5729 TaxID=2086582 RepID=UPI000D110649|nr:oligoribonuclease [Blastococcus sp. Marseille-P5729]
MNDSANSDLLAWIDCEMTGLRLDHDALIEVAAVVTDGDLNVLDEGIDIVIHTTDEMLESMPPVVVEMHAASGLTDEVRRSTVSLEQAEQLVVDYLSKHIKTHGTVPLCGNSIGVDRGFIARDMPRVNEMLHYRMIDVSSIKELTRRWYPRAYYNKPEKGLAHRALADILESVTELRYYRETVFVPLPGPSSEEAKQVALSLAPDRTPAGDHGAPHARS